MINMNETTYTIITGFCFILMIIGSIALLKIALINIIKKVNKETKLVDRAYAILIVLVRYLIYILLLSLVSGFIGKALEKYIMILI